MISERDLLETIEDCKAVKNPTASTVNLLASCLIVRDSLYPDESRQERYPRYSFAAAQPEDSDFVKAAKNADFEKLLSVLDKHMDSIQALYPKEYDSILRQLK